MELKDTVELMQSGDHRDRLRAEYWQLADRHKKLVAMLSKWDTGTLDFVPACPRGTYDFQTRAMADYMTVLEMRAVMEGVKL